MDAATEEAQLKMQAEQRAREAESKLLDAESRADYYFAETCGDPKEVALKAAIKPYEAEIAALRRRAEQHQQDMKKPPQERDYCVGCSLPGEVETLREELKEQIGITEFRWRDDLSKLLGTARSRTGIILAIKRLQGSS
jgi:hypothetical protein